VVILAAMMGMVGMVSPAGCAGVKRLGRASPTPGTSAHPLALGQPHVFDWADGGRKLEVMPLKVERGHIGDLAHYDLKAADKKMTPYYVRFRFRNAGKAPLESTDFGGSLHVALTDAADRPLHSLMLLDLFGGGKLPCQNKKSTANWPVGASLESCTIFLGDPNATPASLAYSVPVISGLVQEKALVWWKVLVA
jgi:hypothetical protein